MASAAIRQTGSLHEGSDLRRPLGYRVTLLSQVTLESLDREIAFYRRRSGQVYFFSLGAEALILVGRENVALSGGPSWVSPVVESGFFVAVAFFGIRLGSEYRRRIRKLKRRRLYLVESFGHRDMFPTENDQKRSEIRVLYEILIFLSLAGVLLTWLAWWLSSGE